MSTALLLASLCVLGEPEEALVVRRDTWIVGSIFATSLLSLPQMVEFETYFVVKRGRGLQVVRLRTPYPVPSTAKGMTFIPTCKALS